MPVLDNVRARAHNGPRNLQAICLKHAEENGPRPLLQGLKGDAKRNAIRAQGEWDRGLMGRSTVISQGVNNGVAIISVEGLIIPAPRTR